MHSAMSSQTGPELDAVLLIAKSQKIFLKYFFLLLLKEIFMPAINVSFFFFLLIIPLSLFLQASLENVF